jgi:hypothetical protein
MVISRSRLGQRCDYLPFDVKYELAIAAAMNALTDAQLGWTAMRNPVVRQPLIA